MLRRIFGFGVVMAPTVGLAALPLTNWLDQGQARLATLGSAAWFVVSVAAIGIIEVRPWWRRRHARPVAPTLIAPVEPQVAADPKAVTRQLVDLVKEGRALVGRVANTVLETWVADPSVWTAEVNDWCARCHVVVHDERPRFLLELEAAITRDVSAHHQWDARAPMEAIRNALAIDAHGERLARIRAVLTVMEKIVAAET